MSAATLPPPLPPICLTRSSKSRGHKGGTVIAEDVLDLETHRKRLLDPDDYRSVITSCWSCGTSRLHALCFRERVLRGAVGKAPGVETVRLYRCALKTCGAVFTVLPAIIARQLWRLWNTVEQATAGNLDVPRTTRRRWRSRLQSSASPLTQILCAQARSLSGDLFRSKLPGVRNRSALIEAFHSSLRALSVHPFALLAAWIQRLQPGIRLM